MEPRRYLPLEKPYRADPKSFALPQEEYLDLLLGNVCLTARR